MKYSIQEIDDLREAVIAHQKQKFRLRRSELNMVHVESMVRTYMEAGIKADEILAVVDERSRCRNPEKIEGAI